MDYYEFKEHAGGAFRGVVISPEEGRVDFVTGADETHIIALTDLAFLMRAARCLVPHVLDGVAPPPAGAAPVPAPVASKDRPERAGKRWSEEEVEQAVNLFASGTDIAQIAKMHKRSPAAIVSHLLKLKRIEVTVIR